MNIKRDEFGRFIKGHKCYTRWKGNHHSEESKRKMSLSHKGKVMSKVTKEKIRMFHFGKKKSKKHCKNISLGRKKRFKRLGYLNSTETRKRMSLALKGRKVSEERRQEIIRNLTGRPASKKTIESLRLRNIGNKYKLGFKCSDETKEKISLGNKGKQLSEETKERIRKNMKKLWQNPTYRETQRKLTLKGLCKRPTKPERVLMDLIEKNNLPFSYVGNGKIIIEGFNPDFIDSDGSKQVIEVNGDFWHRIPKMMEKDERKLKAYRKYGYKTLIIWENELTKNLDETKIVEKIKNIATNKQV